MLATSDDPHVSERSMYCLPYYQLSDLLGSHSQATGRPVCGEASGFCSGGACGKSGVVRAILIQRGLGTKKSTHTDPKMETALGPYSGCAT